MNKLWLHKLSVLNFKNYEEGSFEFSPGANCFVGKNGRGKTNLLDAIYYLSFCKSYFNPVDSQNIRFDAPLFVIQGAYTINEVPEILYCGLKRNHKKVFKRNQKEYERLADHIGHFPLVMVAPTDAVLITEGSEERRRFMDSIISQYDKIYLDKLMAYNKALVQRNALLKKFWELRYFDKETLEIWDEQLCLGASYIYTARQDFLKEFVPIFRSYFEFISGGSEEVDVIYESNLNQAPLMDLLHLYSEKDRHAHHTTHGLHKDDLHLLLNSFPVKKFASQGQQKTFLLALKLAQFDYIKNKTATIPLLLLDDIYEKLDESRVTKLMELVNKGNFGQIFITDTHKERIENVFHKIDSEVRIIEVGA